MIPLKYKPHKQPTEEESNMGLLDILLKGFDEIIEFPLTINDNLQSIAVSMFGSYSMQ